MEEDDDDDDDEEMPEKTGKTPWTLPSRTADSFRYKQIRKTMPNKYILTGKYRVRTLNLQFGVQTEMYKNRIDTVRYPIQKTSGSKH